MLNSYLWIGLLKSVYDSLPRTITRTLYLATLGCFDLFCFVYIVTLVRSACISKKISFPMGHKFVNTSNRHYLHFISWYCSEFVCNLGTFTVIVILFTQIPLSSLLLTFYDFRFQGDILQHFEHVVIKFIEI